jgi:hypothetical protein
MKFENWTNYSLAGFCLHRSRMDLTDLKYFLETVDMLNNERFLWSNYRPSKLAIESGTYLGRRGSSVMGNEQDQDHAKTEKKHHVKLCDLTVSKEAHVIGGASGKHQAKLRDLAAWKDAHIIRDSGQ